MFNGVPKALAAVTTIIAVLAAALGGALAGGVAYFNSRWKSEHTVENAAMDRVADFGGNPRSARCQPLTPRVHLCTVVHRDGSAPEEIECFPRRNRPGFTCFAAVPRTP